MNAYRIAKPDEISAGGVHGGHKGRLGCAVYRTNLQAGGNARLFQWPNNDG